MEWIEVNVECYSGYKADEYPKCFYLNNDRYEISEISDRWYQTENRGGLPNSDYFKILTEQGSQYVLRHDLKQDTWFLKRI